MIIMRLLKHLYKILIGDNRIGNRLKPVLDINKGFPDGHFYSPIVDTKEALRDKERIWPNNPGIHNINFNEEEQLHWLTDILPKHLPTFNYPAKKPIGADRHIFHTDNSQFSGLDALGLHMMLHELRPRHMVEIGSGFSSLLTADINRHHLGSELDFTCIEPYPRAFLSAGAPGITRVIEKQVQDVPMTVFTSLAAGDILFIDSSHVAKTGSDVNHIYFQIIPHLPAGVIIHIHDIFFPSDYPKAWVIEEGRSWNEQYLVQALLMYSQGFRVLFGSHYIQTNLTEKLSEILGDKVCGGGSLWLQKTL